MNPTPHHWKEGRRSQAWQLRQKGWPQHQIAEALGVSAAAVGQWLKRTRLGGLQALRHQPPPGAPRRLAPDQLARLPDLRHRAPEAYGVRGQVWPRKQVAEVVRVAFGTRYHPIPVGRLLNALRWSPQKPMRRARQRDEAAITHRRTEAWPAINKGRQRSGRRSSS